MERNNILNYQAQSYQAERCNSTGDFQRGLVADGKFLTFVLRDVNHTEGQGVPRGKSQGKKKGLWGGECLMISHLYFIFIFCIFYVKFDFVRY